MNTLKIVDTQLSGLKVVERNCLGDERGFLSRMFCAKELEAVGWRNPVLQINHTHTRNKGTVRGMHYQHTPHAEMKLVSCLNGEVWDVAVDIRRDSPTFLQWHAEVLSSSNFKSLLIPEGFAHGFQTLTNDVDLLYLHSAFYKPEAEDGINAMDTRLAIDWPLPPQLLSKRDQILAEIDDSFPGVNT